MKKILITGAGGFIGSHLSELCVKRGYKVKAFVHYNSNSRAGWLDCSKQKKQMDIIAGDIRDFDSVSQAMKGCDTVFHLAALIGIPYSYRSPLAYVKTNIEGTYNVVEAAKAQSVKNILITSTSETYGTAEYVPIDERHPKKGQSPYAASKIAADQLALSYYRSFNSPVTVIRPFNTYGPRQSARAIIPTVVTQILEGKRSLNLGHLQPTRDFTFVEDAAKGFCEVVKAKKLIGEEVNIGRNEEISIGDLARLIAKLMGKKITFLKDTKRLRPQKSEVEQLRCDNSKILKATAWKPSYDLEKGLMKTISWISKNTRMYKSGMYHV